MNWSRSCGLRSLAANPGYDLPSLAGQYIGVAFLEMIMSLDDLESLQSVGQPLPSARSNLSLERGGEIDST